MCPVHLCVPSDQHSAWHRVILHKCLRSAGQGAAPPLASQGAPALPLALYESVYSSLFPTTLASLENKKNSNSKYFQSAHHSRLVHYHHPV